MASSKKLKYSKYFQHKSISQKKKQILFLRSKRKYKAFHKQSFNSIINCDFEQEILPEDNFVSNFEDNNLTYIEELHSSIEEESKLNVDSDLNIELAVNSNNSLITNRQHLFTSALRNVFLTYNIKHIQGDAVLHVLRTHHCLSYLPRTTKTFLHTPQESNYDIVPLGSGNYVHIGFEKTLKQKLINIPINQLPAEIVIDISTDGATLNKCFQFWPIQYRIKNIKNSKPIIAGIYLGKSKPCDPHKFMKQFVNEVLQVIQNGGISINNKKIPLHIRCFIADAPARALILNHKGHMSSNPCSKCKVEGFRSSNRMIFNVFNSPLRTDIEYKMCIDTEHHHGESPLSVLPMGLVSNVPFEYMHLVLLGVTKKLISAWLEGKYAVSKLSGRQINIISARLVSCSVYCPREFSRRCRSIVDYKNFKATEFRTFLIYTGPSVIRDVVTQNVYIHFLLLSCAIRILMSDISSNEDILFAKQALRKFVILSENLYGIEFMSYNLHGLLHLADDVQLLGKLDSFSAFDFENYMPEFRNFVRKPHLPLQQFIRRLHELNSCDVSLKLNNSCNVIHASCTHKNGPLLQNIPSTPCTQFKLLKTGYITYGCNKRDNCCILKSGIICIIENIVQMSTNYYFIVRRFKKVNNFYDYVIESKLMGMFECYNLSEQFIISLSDVYTKCFRIPKWSGIIGEEDNIIPNTWIVTTMFPDM